MAIDNSNMMEMMKNKMERLAKQDTAYKATNECLNVISAAIAPSASNDTYPKTTRRQLFRIDNPTIQVADHETNK